MSNESRSVLLNIDDVDAPDIRRTGPPHESGLRSPAAETEMAWALAPASTKPFASPRPPRTVVRAGVGIAHRPHRAVSPATDSPAIERGSRPSTFEIVAATPRIVNTEEHDNMTPDERAAVFDECIVRNLDDLPTHFHGINTGGQVCLNSGNMRDINSPDVAGVVDDALTERKAQERVYGL